MLSRRRFLAAAALPVAIAAGCGGGGSGPRLAVPTPSPSPGAAGTPVPASPTVAVPRGGVARIVARRTPAFDTFDADVTGEPSTVDVLGRTHSRLVEYRDFSSGALTPSLAAAWEQPEPQTLVLSVAPTARWHGPSGGGGALTAQDVAESLARTIELARRPGQPAIRRSQDWASVAHVTAPDAATVLVTLNRPDPFILNTLAGQFSFIQSRAAVDSLAADPLSLAAVAGAGPFSFDGDGQEGLVFRANRDGHSTPLLDGLRLSPPWDAVERFLAHDAHRVVVEDRREVAAIEAAAPAALRDRMPFDAPMITTLNAGVPPWNDLRLVEALHLALDRDELATRLLGDRARALPMAFMLPPGTEQQLVLTAANVQAFAGPTGQEARWTEARARWQAAAGPALGQVTVDFPSVFDPRYAASAVVPALLNEALGVDQFRPAVQSYTSISRKAAEGAYGNGNAAFWFGWGPAFNDPVAARTLYEAYHSAGPTARSLGAGSVQADLALEALVTAGTAVGRIQAARDGLAAIAAAGFGGVLTWLVEVHDAFRWPYFTPGGPDGWWGQHFDTAASVDTADPRYRP